MGIGPRYCRSGSGSNLAPQLGQDRLVDLTATAQLWQRPSRLATDGVRLAGVQNWRVVGPRRMVEGRIFPRATMARMVSKEHPGRKGCSVSRTCQGPMAF